MANWNRIELMGNLGADPELKNVNGKSVVSLRIAVNEKWESNGTKHERTDWFTCVAWEKRAEVLAKYLRKGDPLFVSGRLRTKKVKDEKTGEDRYFTDVQIDDFQFLGGGKKPDDSAKPAAPPEPPPADDLIPF